MFSMLLAAASAQIPTAQPVRVRLAPITTGQVEAALNSDGALDIRPVVRAKRILDFATDRVQFDGKCLDIRGTQVGVFN